MADVASRQPAKSLPRLVDGEDDQRFWEEEHQRNSIDSQENDRTSNHEEIEGGLQRQMNTLSTDYHLENNDEDGNDDELPPDHPALRRVQEALKKQLSQRLRELKEELLDKSQKLKTSKSHREDVGVQLYSVQQQLAQVHAELESTQDECNRLLQEREHEEMMLTEVRCRQKLSITQLTRIHMGNCVLSWTFFNFFYYLFLGGGLLCYF